jgi:lipoprotein-anchoring transpeptidase ErfK/SrfK
MSVRSGLSRQFARRRTAATAALLALALAAAGCTATADGTGTPAADGTAVGATSSSAPTVSAARVGFNVPKQSAGTAPVDTVLRVDAEQGTLQKVAVTFGKAQKTLKGSLDADQATWTAQQRLEPGVRYRVQAVAVDDQGLTTQRTRVFRAEPLTLDQQTYPSIAPLAGETVGVGMPVILQFDVPVKDKASIEKHLSVESTPKQAGAWHWISDHEVHWRPKTYWQPGTDVTVHADINSVPAGNGVYGQLSRTSTFHVGDSVISKLDVTTHRMRVFVNGKLARTLPVSAGKPGFTTRNGIKVIIEKFRHKRMDAATTGINPGDPEYYNIENVEYAMRVTYSGEFLHAAPWSVGSQGSANVSHGCVGMSTADAAWLYNLSKRGDIVDVTGSDRQMTLTNGYGDWNESFAEYKQGSALS